MLFPLVKLRRHNVAPKKPKQLVRSHRLGEFLTRAEYRLPIQLQPVDIELEKTRPLTLIAWASDTKNPPRGVGHKAT